MALCNVFLSPAGWYLGSTRSLELDIKYKITGVTESFKGTFHEKMISIHDIWGSFLVVMVLVLPLNDAVRGSLQVSLVLVSHLKALCNSCNRVFCVQF